MAALADTVYISFYKGLGGVGGAAVAGPARTIEALKVWRLRHGGTLYTAFPLAISALAGIERQLPRMPLYLERSRALAARIGAPAIVNPTTPHTNAFQLWIEGSPAELAERHRAFARAHGVWLFNNFMPSPLTSRSIAEIVVGDGSDGWTIDEAAGWIATFLAG